MRKIKLAIVTTYPPGKGTLNEYAYHFVRFLRKKIDVSEIILLTDELSAGQHYTVAPSSPEIGVPMRIIPCWRFEAWNNPLRILAAIKACKPDAVLFNLQFASFGSNKIAATLGLLTPPLTRVMGVPNITLMHNLMDTIDLKSAGFGSSVEGIIRFFGTIITRLLLTTNLVAVTIPKYVELLEQKYGVQNVMLAPHGAFEEVPLPPFEAPTGSLSILTFGKFGTYKRIESLIEAFKLLQAENRPNLELIVAGTDSPNAAGYLDNMKNTYSYVSGLRFTGYVPEENVPTIFKQATVVVFPYTSTTGSSGVLHQAGEYGKALVLPHIGDFADVIADEGYTGKFFEPENVPGLAQAIASLLDNPQERETLGQQNYLASRGLPMNEVVDWYLIHFQQLLNANKRTDRMIVDVQSSQA